MENQTIQPDRIGGGVKTKKKKKKKKKTIFWGEPKIYVAPIFHVLFGTVF